MRNFIYIFLCVVFLFSCDFLVRKEQQNAIARVNESYLYEDDITDLVTDETSKEDSILIVNNYVNRWATQQLLIDGAELNISEEKQSEFNKLVDQYRKDLFTKAYLEALVNKNLDKTVSIEEAEEFYAGKVSQAKIFKVNKDGADFDIKVQLKTIRFF